MFSFAGAKVLSRRQRRAETAIAAGEEIEDVEDVDESESNRGFAWAHLVMRFRRTAPPRRGRPAGSPTT